MIDFLIFVVALSLYLGALLLAGFLLNLLFFPDMWR